MSAIAAGVVSLTSAAAAVYAYLHFREENCRVASMEWKIHETCEREYPAAGRRTEGQRVRMYINKWQRSIRWAESKQLLTHEEAVAGLRLTDPDECAAFASGHLAKNLKLPIFESVETTPDYRLERDRGVPSFPCRVIRWRYGPAEGLAIAEYGDVVASKMTTYNEHQASVIYNNLKFCNAPLHDIVELRAGTLDYVRARLLEATISRISNDEVFNIRQGHIEQLHRRLREHVFALVAKYNYSRHCVRGMVLAAAALLSICVFGGLQIRHVTRSQGSGRARAEPEPVPRLRPLHFVHAEELPYAVDHTWMYEDVDYSTPSVAVPPLYEGPRVVDRDPPRAETFAAMKPQRSGCRFRAFKESGKCTSHPRLCEANYWPILYNRADPASFHAAATGRVFVRNPPIRAEVKPVLSGQAAKLAARLPVVQDLDLLSEENRIRWVASRPYSCKRKAQMIEAIRTDPSWRIDTFVKDEAYLEPGKAPRLINAANDARKTIFGPLFDAMNASLFCLPETTKHVPVRERPRYIDEYLMADDPSRVVFVTDMSAFECSMTAEMQQLVEFVVYKRILPGVYHKFLDRLLDDVTAVNVQTGVELKFSAIRLSGEMNTSLGNTITNLVSIYSACEILGVHEPRCVVEGDDAMVSVPRGVDPDRYVEVMRSMGYNIKMEAFDVAPGMGGYCSMYWLGEAYVVDPLKTLLCWPVGGAHGSAEDQLACKAISLATSCPGVPICHGLAAHYLKPRGVMKFNAYERDELEREGAVVDLVGDCMVVTASVHLAEPSESSFALMAELLGCSAEDIRAADRELALSGRCDWFLEILLGDRSAEFLLL